LGLVLIFTFAGVFAEYAAPHDPYAVDITKKLLSRGSDFLMGTDQLGRCIFSRLIFGIRTSLATVVAATVMMALIGLPLGILAGYGRNSRLHGSGIGLPAEYSSPVGL
jgi:ABC-type dipeptide/oligopeptide/nickel transport system permease subunit